MSLQQQLRHLCGHEEPEVGQSCVGEVHGLLEPVAGVGEFDQGEACHSVGVETGEAERHHAANVVPDESDRRGHAEALEQLAHIFGLVVLAYPSVARSEAPSPRRSGTMTW